VTASSSRTRPIWWGTRTLAAIASVGLISSGCGLIAGPSRAAIGALPLTDVSGGVDHVAFTLDGARRHWDLAVDAPWVDRTVFSRLVSLLHERGIERRYIYLGLGVRYFVTACLTPQALRMLRALGGRRVLWLE
jgi:hypothetical protein